MKLRKTTATLLILLALAMIAPMTVMAPPIQETIQVWWLEDADRNGGDGTQLPGWSNDRIPNPEDYPKDYIEFAVHGKSYHALEVEAFYNYYPLVDFESSPFVIANGKFAFWARYKSPRSELPILDKMRGKLTIYEGEEEDYTAEGTYVQYSYAFGTADDVLDWYPNAKESPRTQGMWLLGITYYTVHGQTPTT